MNNNLVTTREAAEHLGIGRAMVAAYIRDGRLKARRYGPDKGGMYLIDRADLVRFRLSPRGWRKGRKRVKAKSAGPA